MKNIFFTLIGVFSLVMSPIAATAQVATGTPYTLEQAVIAGGGGKSTSEGVNPTFSLEGTIGQAVAGEEVLTSEDGIFSVTSGFWNFTPAPIVAQGFEGDIAPRSSGGSGIGPDDLIQARRFLVNLDLPLLSNEYQRLDTAPLGTFGGGGLGPDDLIQMRRYSVNLDGGQTQPAAGPTAPPPPLPSEESQPIAAKTQRNRGLLAAVAPEVRVESRSAIPGEQSVTVNIRVDAIGNEAAYRFKVSFNSAILIIPATGGTANGTAGGLSVCNRDIPGEYTCVIDSYPQLDPPHPQGSSDQIGEIAAGDNQQLMRVRFNIAANAPSGPTPLTLTEVRASTDAPGGNIDPPPTATNGIITVVGPAAASVAVSGRVFTPRGRGLKNARVLLTDSNGNSRSALTSTFGHYRFDNVESGQTVIVSVSSRRYQFAPQVVTVTDQITGLDFHAEP